MRPAINTVSLPYILAPAHSRFKPDGISVGVLAVVRRFSKSVADVFDFLQTPDGWLWLGTEFGLARFDGFAQGRPPKSIGLNPIPPLPMALVACDECKSLKLSRA